MDIFKRIIKFLLLVIVTSDGILARFIEFNPNVWLLTPNVSYDIIEFEEKIYIQPASYKPQRPWRPISSLLGPSYWPGRETNNNKKNADYNCYYQMLYEAVEIKNIEFLEAFIEKQDDYFNILELSRFVRLIARKLVTDKYRHLMKIIRKVWAQNFTKFWIRNFLQVLEGFLTNIPKNATVIDPKYYLAVWYPLKNNVIGYALKASSNSYIVLEIYSNQSSENINVADVEMAAYVPYEFLENLVWNTTQEEKENLRIVMLFLYNDRGFLDILRPDVNIKQLIGLAIPQFCKRNSLPLLRMFSPPTIENPTGIWADFGSKYFDQSNKSKNNCLLNNVSYFGHVNDEQYEHQKKLYCLRKQFKTRSSFKDAWVNNNGKVYPTQFCMDEYFRIPQAYCPSAVYGQEYSYNFRCFEQLSVSNITEVIYSLYVQCLKNIRNCTLEAINETNLVTFVDVYIYMKILITKKELSVTETSKLLAKSLGLIAEQSKNKRQMTFICEFLNLFASNEKMFFSPNFTYFKIESEDEDEGFVFNKQYSNDSNEYAIDRIFSNNLSADHSITDNTEIIVLMSNNILKKNSCRIDFFVIYNNKYSEYENYTCQSRILGIKHNCKGKNNKLKLKIYLKTVDNKRMRYTQGYWVNVDILSTYFAMVCISELVENICDSESKLHVYQKYKNDFVNDIITKRKRARINILSQVAVSMNPASKDLYQRHHKALEMIILTGSSFSILSVLCLFSCVIFLKDWYKQRLYSIQLSLTFIFEITFFLINSESYTHSHYIIFYYGILSQFTWMLLIGHIQYIKFIKILHTSSLTILKSLIIGWLPPALIIGLSILVHPDCLKCNLCYQNDDIFAYFVVIPISLVILCNLITYALILIKLLKSNFEMSVKVATAKLRALIMFPFLFGITWICILPVISPVQSVSLIGSYLFHIIVPSQGFVLFIFVVLLDKETVNAWRNKFN